MFNLPNETRLEKLERWFSRQQRKFNEAIWWVKYRVIPKHKYHMLNLGTKPGYSDVCERLIHANFQLLKEFVEKENPLEEINWDTDPQRQFVAKEIKELYNWWINIRPKRDEQNPIYKVDVPPRDLIPIKNGYQMVNAGTEEQEKIWRDACNELTRLEALWEKEDCDNLKRLADIRLYLWT